jgi:predicted dehydrogenase
MSAVRMAVAGAGLIGARHIEEIRKSARAQLSAIVDVSPAAADLAAGLGVPAYACVDELLERDKPDGLIVATPNRFHADQAIQSVEAGVPALVEKPLAHTLQDGVRLCEAAERTGVAVLVGHHRRHSPILRAAVDVVRSGILGPVVGVMGSAVFYKPDSDGYYDGPNAWRREPGGGPILINMIHEIDNLRALVGEIVAVQAMASNTTRRFEVEDTVAIGLRFANGALGTFLLSDTGASPRSWEQTSGENDAFFTDPDEDCYAVIGTRGSLGIPTLRLRYYERDGDRSWNKPFRTRRVPVERHDPLATQIEHFVRVVRGEAPPLVSARDGLQNLRVIDAIGRAASRGGVVEVAIP